MNLITETRYRTLLISLVALLCVAMWVVAPAVAQPTAEISADDVGIENPGETAQSTISIENATEGVDIADVTVSVESDSPAELVAADNATPPGNSVITFKGQSAEPDLSGNSVTFEYSDTDSDETGTITLGTIDIKWNESASGEDPPSTKIAVSSGLFENGDGDSFDLTPKNGTVGFGSEFLLDGLSPEEDAAVKGDTVSYDVNVENDGQAAGNQTVGIQADGDEVKNKTVQLGAKESQTVSFSVDTGDIGFGDFDITVDSADDSVTGNLRVSDNLTPANVSSSDVSIPEVGETGNSSISIDVPEGLQFGDVAVSVNTSVARIVDARHGEDINTSLYNTTAPIKDLTNDSVKFRYTNIEGLDGVKDFELGVVEFELVGEGDTPISLETEFEGNNLYKNASVPYAVINERDGTVSDSLFNEKLNVLGAEGPPQNLEDSEGGIEGTPELYEDLTGDGDGLSTTQTVSAYGQLRRERPLADGGLTDEQASALSWNPFSPEDEVTPADMVSLYGEQRRAGE